MPKPTKHAQASATPEWTAEHQARAIPFAEKFPSLAAEIKGRRGRGPQKMPTKQSVTMRLSPEVIVALRATGRGWQTRVDTILRKWVDGQPKRATKS